MNNAASTLDGRQVGVASFTVTKFLQYMQRWMCKLSAVMGASYSSHEAIVGTTHHVKCHYTGLCDQSVLGSLPAPPLISGQSRKISRAKQGAIALSLNQTSSVELHS